jgi:hypothetical protein
MKTYITVMLTITGVIFVMLGVLMAQPVPQNTDPVFWCDLSRSQVSHERDAGLALIEALKLRNASLDARVKELEAKAKEAKPNE